MLISDEHKFVFIHATKTGGKSISASLPEGSLDHPSSLGYYRIHETAFQFAIRQPVIFTTYKTFSIVRHPARRFRSLYQFFTQRKPVIPELLPVRSIDDFIRYIQMDIPLTITDKCNTRVEPISTIVAPLSGVLGMGSDSQVDRWYKLELLSEQWEEVLQWLGLAYRPLQHVNESMHKPVEGDRWKSFVKEYYRQDFVAFDYSAAF